MTIFKSGERNLIKNYRPISLLCNISKVFERIIYDKIISFVSDRISPFQFGALKGRSSLQQLLIFIDHIITSNTQTDVIYLDISKAFDSNELLTKLHSIGFKGKLWMWFKTIFLTESRKSV